MKKIFTLTVIGLLTIPAFAQSTTTTTTTTDAYDEEVVSPSSNANMIQAEEEEGYDDSTLDSEDVEQERMEERNSKIKETDSVDYNDRTRTNRERKAINTGSDASDDQ